MHAHTINKLYFCAIIEKLNEYDKEAIFHTTRYSRIRKL